MEILLLSEIDSFCKANPMSEKFKNQIVQKFRFYLERSYFHMNEIDIKKIDEEQKLIEHERKIKLKQIQIFIDTRLKEIESYKVNREKLEIKNVEIDKIMESKQKFTDHSFFFTIRAVLYLLIFLMCLYLILNKLSLINF